MVVLRKTKDSIGEAELKRLAGDFWRKISVLSQHQIFDVATGKVLPQGSFIKKRWQPIIKNLRKILAMEDGNLPPVELVYSELHADICIFINKKMQSEAFKMTPVSKVPRLVYWELTKRAGERAREANIKRLEVRFDEDFQGYGTIDDPRMLNPNCMYFDNQFYILIDGIAEDVGVSSQTLRNWEKRKLIQFAHIPYKSMVKRIPFSRGVPYDELSTFVERIRKIQQQNLPTIGYVPTDTALKKLGIHHTTLKRRRDSGKIRYERRGNKYFYKV